MVGSSVTSNGGGDAGRWLAADRGGLWSRATVTDVVPDPSGATTLQLRLPETPQLLAGQYYLVRLAVDTSPGAVEQAYSVSSSPYPPTREIDITVREVPGGRVSRLLARRVRTGDLLHVRGPFGDLTWTEADGGPLVLVGAGTGVAPLLSIVRYAAARGSAMSMTLLCSSRDGASVLLRSALDELAEREPWLSVVHTFTRSADDGSARYHRRVDAPMIAEVAGEMGGAALVDMSFFVAGPTDMVSTVRDAISSLGVADARIQTELHA